MRTRLSIPLGIVLAGWCATCCLAAGIPQNNLDSLLESGVKLAQAERYTEAIQVFENCVREHPESFEAHYNLALALFALERFPEAREAIENVRAARQPEQLTAQYLLGKIDEALGRLPQARRELSAAFEGSPGEENYALDLGLLLIRQSDYRGAMQVFGRATQVHPQSAYVLLGLAMAQAFGGKPGEAAASCKQILKNQPAFAPAELLLAFSHYMSGGYEEAERVAASGLRSPSASPYLYYVHAATLLKLNSTEYTRMLQELDAANREIPFCSLCYFVRSKVLQASGDAPAAIADLETLVTRIAPDFDQAWYRLAALYQRAGRQQDSNRARAKFEAIKARGVDPDTELVRTMLVPKLQR
ncbi:MAG: tetratricopeptide repeat protein [Bryobacteraceae bacterium]